MLWRRKDTDNPKCPHQLCQHYQKKCGVCCRQKRLDMFEEVPDVESIEMIPIMSGGISGKSIKKIGYDKNSSQLYVHFINGHYRYYGVPQSVYEEMMKTPNIVQYFSTHIRDKFRCTKIQGVR